jgi:glycosyltransferase involved in cell wall biosynthesis
MKDHLEARARELGVAQSTIFLGYVPHWEYLELLNSSDILCFPSRNEPFGLVLLEAWAAGKPVVASDVGGLGENIENFTDGIKVYVNPDSVAWGINYLLNSPEAMRKIAEGGAAKVKNFEWKILAGKLKDTYLTVLKGR